MAVAIIITFIFKYK